MTFLITGGTGFIGSSIARRLTARGENVVLYDLYPNLDLIRDITSEVEIVRGDVLDPLRLAATIETHKIDHMIHLAYLLTSASKENPLMAIRVNLEGTNNAFNAAAILNLKRVVYASSIALYAPSSRYPQQPVDEDALLKPESLYGACKAFDEVLSQYYSNNGLDVIGLRPTWVYGARVSGGLIGELNNLIKKPALGQPAPLPSSWRKSKIDWIYIEDVADAFVAACYAERPRHTIFNLGSGELRPIEDAVSYVKELIPNSVFENAESQHKISDQVAIDSSQIRSELGFQASYRLKDGIVDMISKVKLSKSG